ncbi:MAG: cytochrome c biogenesis protein ResB [Bacteroidales bacterium]|nr:cytochrome c biogenesis protein ResB [Bacteroidales bacterium]
MSQKNPNKKKKSRLWQFPWGYRESFLIAFFVLLSGFLIQLLFGGGVRMPAWPANIAIILIFIIYFILIHYLVKHPIVKWLSSTYAAIASITAFTFIVLLLGFIPQGVNSADPSLLDSLGLTHVTSSWPYLMSALLLLVVLGFTIIRRINNFSLKNISFLLNHIGLWIVIVAASLGSSDMWRLSMQLEEKHPTINAYDANGNTYNMGFGMMLLDFEIETYPPELGIMNNKDYTLVLEKGGKLATVVEGEQDQLDEYTLFFEKVIPFARKYGDVYDTTSREGGARAVYVIVTNQYSDTVAKGWVSDGSYAVPSSQLAINKDISVAMTQLRPKKYSSDIRLYRSMDDYEDFYIEVNKPVKIDGWKIYQTGYDELMGRWSKKSIIELVRDPWLPVVYTGIFMILIGSLYLLWMGKGRIKTKKS